MATCQPHTPHAPTLASTLPANATSVSVASLDASAPNARATPDAPAAPAAMDTSRLRRMLGDKGVARLAAARVLVVGLGGVGSSCAEALARAGVGHLSVVDKDVVEPSNANRQALAFQSTMGRPKAEVMRAMILDINPAADVNARRMFVQAHNVAEVFDPRPDFAVDAVDSVAPKLALAQYAFQHDVPLVSAMGAGNKYDPTRFEFADIAQTSVCPLAKAMRRECRRRGIGRLRVLYSREEPLPVPLAPGGTRGDRSNIGTMSYMPPIMGQMIAGDVIRAILGLPRA